MKPNEQTRYELLAAISQLGKLRPEWRLGQTLANLAMTAGRIDPGGVWDVEDDEALAAANTLIKQYSEPETQIANQGDASETHSAERPIDNEIARSIRLCLAYDESID